jgi:type IV pilus assembly protein PilA
MRAFKRYSRAGFTLVELMIVVAIIGILAALAIYGVRRYLQSAKASEAKNSIGAIARGAVGAYERETTPAELLGEGTAGEAFVHEVCTGATAVPGTVPAGNKYQPNSEDGTDFETGTLRGGWRCLKFQIGSPIYYRYGYQSVLTEGSGELGDDADNTNLGAPTTAGTILVWACGDLDGDGVPSGFGQRGAVNNDTKSIRLATEIEVFDEYE